MTDADLIGKKLAFIETCVRDLDHIAQPERIGSDIREERFIAHTPAKRCRRLAASRHGPGAPVF